MTGKTTDGRTRVGIGKKLADRLEILLSLLTIPCGLGFFHSLESGEPSARYRILLPAAFLFLSLITLLRAAANRARPSAPFRRRMDVLFAGAFFLCAVLGLAVQNSLIPWLVADSVILVWLIAGRAVAIAREPRSWKGILNAALLLMFGALLLFLWSKGTKPDEALFGVPNFTEWVMLFLAMTSFCRIMGVTFARIRLDLLREIIRKTFAAEIISGLLLLIFAFSWVLVFTDPNFAHYTDALWYCFAIVTTIGFGDYAAGSTVGRILSVALGLYGIVVVALITSIIVNFYGEMKKADPDGPPAENSEKKARTEEQ